VRAGIEAATVADSKPVGRQIPDAECGKQRGACALAHGKSTVPAGDHGRHRGPAYSPGYHHERRTDRKNRRLHPEYHRILHGLLPCPHACDTAYYRHGPDVFKGPAGTNAAGYAGAAREGRREKPVFREHDLEEELPLLLKTSCMNFVQLKELKSEP